MGSAFWPDVLGGFVLGALLGSFANVLIYRLPRDESIVWPGSRCPHCGAPIGALDNIPMVSFLLLRGRCRSCHERISSRYPLVELLTAVLVAAAWVVTDTVLARASATIFVFLLVVITFIDLDHQLILDRLSLPGTAVGLAVAALQHQFVPALAAALGAAALILIVVVVSRGGMGGGDIKLAGMMGAFLGWPGIAVGLFSGVMVGGIVGVGLLVTRRLKRKDAIPFGPALAAGGLVALYWGDAIARWYWP
jgi:leader peptidase (prepilin peptidase) / N-methyltransferase